MTRSPSERQATAPGAAGAAADLDVTVVIPTLARPSLSALLGSLAAQDPLPAAVVIVDDRPPRTADAAARIAVPAALADRIRRERTGGRGPAAARNAGARRAVTSWVAFLDDDVVVRPDWSARLAEDLESAAPLTAAVQGRIDVPGVPERPTDWQRQVAGLADAAWITADLAVRRRALEAVGGFDERFPRAYREDADLALRLQEGGWSLARGSRRVDHPVPPADRWASVRRQAGNADDALMRVLHGADWRARASAPPGRRPRHLVVTAALAGGLAALATGRRRLAAVPLAVWAAGTGELAWARIRPGPRTADEILTMLATSAAIPPAAVWHWLRGWLRVAMGAGRSPGPAERIDVPGPGDASPRSGSTTDPPGALEPSTPRRTVRAVLFDRDGTLVLDEPYNGDPDRVVPAPDARAALDLLRAAGIPTAVVSNQSGVARGLLTSAEVHAVNARVEDLLGPLGPVLWCPHGPDEGCGCRKPAPGLVLDAAAALGVDPHECVVVGDIGSDVDAAHAAGARAILVPTEITRAEEITAAPAVAPDLSTAVRRILEGAV